MLKRITLLFVLAATALLPGCTKKTYDDALPKVDFVSALAYGNDSVIVTGNVTSAGASPIEYVGFAYSTNPTFDILENQVIGNGTTGEFSTLVRGFQDSTYYFKCFAANSFGYVVSNTFKYTVPAATPQTAPCSVTNNTVIDNSQTYYMNYVATNSVSAAYGNFEVDAENGSSEIVDIYFNATPTNGVYTTQVDAANFSFDTNPYDCVVTVNGYAVNTGGKVYVGINSGTTTVSFCSLIYVAYSTNFSISGKVSY